MALGACDTLVLCELHTSLVVGARMASCNRGVCLQCVLVQLGPVIQHVLAGAILVFARSAWKTRFCGFKKVPHVSGLLDSGMSPCKCGLGYRDGLMLDGSVCRMTLKNRVLWVQRCFHTSGSLSTA